MGGFDKAFEKASKEFESYFKDQWMQQTLKYDGPDIRVKLIISDQIFETSASVIFNRKHGVTTFIHEFLGTDKNSINYNCNAEDKDANGDLLKVDEVLQGKMNEVIHKKENNKMIELYFDRDPELFHYILNYLRGYPIQNELHDLHLNTLQNLQSDVEYFGLDDMNINV